MSMTGLDDYLPRVPQSSREAGPPVTTRGFNALGRAGSVRDPRSGLAREDVVPRDYARDEYDAQARKPRSQVAVHQPSNDAYGAVHRDDRDYDARHTNLRKPVNEEDRVDTKPRDLYSELKPRDPYAEPKTRDPYGDSKPRDLYADVKPRDTYAEPKPRDPYIEAKPRDPHNEPKARDPYDDHRNDARDSRSHRHRHHRDRHRDTDYNDDRDRERDSVREERHREKRDHGDAGRGGDAAILGAAGLAATGLAAEGVRQHRSHRDRDYDAQDKSRDTDRDRLGVAQDHIETTSVGGEGSEESRERHRRRRREREERRAREEEEARKAREIPPKDEDRRLREPEALSVPRDPALREQTSYERPSADRHPSHERHPSYERTNGPADTSFRPHRRHQHHSRTQDKDSYSESSSSSDSDSYDSRPRTVRVVTPTEEPVEPKEPPKSILRPPREKFPEDPAPVREGVAPLKDAGKKGIPPNARWTKIDRKLVNPEALDMGNERYEERTDYVIVLRVLTKEEIEQYALKTQEIRGKRPPPPADGNREGSYDAST